MGDTEEAVQLSFRTHKSENLSRRGVFKQVQKREGLIEEGDLKASKSVWATRPSASVSGTNASGKRRAADQIRTDDLRFTKASLCQLSYGGSGGVKNRQNQYKTRCLTVW